MPPGSGVPVPGATAGSSTSTPTVRNTGPRRQLAGLMTRDRARELLADAVASEPGPP